MGAAIDIANYLGTQGLGTAGTDIFAHRTPNSPNAMMSVYTFGSPMAFKSHGKGATKAVWAIKENIQVQYRHKKRASAVTKMRTVFEKLESAGGFTATDGNEYLYIECTRFPGQLRVDENDRTIFFAEFRCVYRSGL